MLISSTMKAPDAAPDKKTMMPKMAMTESAVIIAPPLGSARLPMSRAECFPCLYCTGIMIQSPCMTSAKAVQLQCKSA
jgi:hypothetical protein